MALTQIDDRGLKTPIDLIDNEKIRLGTGNDLELYHDGTNSHLNNSTGYLVVGTDSYALKSQNLNEFYIKALKDGAVELYYDNAKKLETSSIGVNLTGNLTLDAEINLLGGSDAARFIDSQVGDGNALHLRRITGGDAGHEDMAKFTGGGAVELYYDNSKKFETTSAGVSTTGTSLHTDNIKITVDNGAFYCGAGDDLGILHDGTDTTITNNTGNLLIYSANDFYIKHGTEVMFAAKDDGATELYYDGTKKLSTGSGGIIVSGNSYMDDDNKLILGSDNDLQIYHNGYNSKIADVGTGALILSGSVVKIENAASNETQAVFTEDAGVDLYHNNSKVFETLGNGVRAQGGIMFGSDTADANRITDYEEGTWTPTYTAAGTNPTLTSHLTTGYYTKVGNLVTVTHYTGSFTLSGSPSGTPYIGGLPFAAKSTGNNYATNSFTHTTCFTTAAGGYVSNGGSTIVAIQHGDTTSGAAWKSSGTQYLMIHFTYLAA